MSSLRQGILGGLAGGFEAGGEIIDDRIEEKREQKKQAALLKRQKTLAKFQHDLQMQGQEASWEHQADVRAEERDYKEDQAGSGKFLGGKELTNAELAELPATEHPNLKTASDVASKQKQAEHARKKDLATHKAKLKAEIEKIKKQGDFDDDRFEAVKGEALTGARAFISSHGGTSVGMEEDEQSYLIPKESFGEGGMTSKKVETLKKGLRNYGFEVYLNENEDGVQVDLGRWNHDKVSAPKEQPKVSSKFDSLLEKTRGEGSDEGFLGKATDWIKDKVQSDDEDTGGSKSEQPVGAAAPSIRPTNRETAEKNFVEQRRGNKTGPAAPPEQGAGQDMEIVGRIPAGEVYRRADGRLFVKTSYGLSPITPDQQKELEFARRRQ